MQRLLALGCLAALVLSASALVLWPRELRRPDVAQPQESPAANAPSLNVVQAPDVSNSTNAGKAFGAAWPAFIEACRRKEFAIAKELAPKVKSFAAERCSDLLALPRDVTWDETQGKALRSVAGVVLAGHDEQSAHRIRATALLEYERCWPTKASLDEIRKSRVASEVNAKPIDVPEREALLHVDWLYVDVVRLGHNSRGTALRALLETAARTKESERACYEPLLSAWIQSTATELKSEAQQIAREFVDSPNLSLRLRWELRVLALADGANLNTFLKAIEPQHCRMGQALREALKAGLTVEELLRIVIPYLESRYGVDDARRELFGVVAGWIRNASAGQFAMFVSGACASFLEAERGGGLATLYLQMLSIGANRRDIDQTGRALIEELPEGARIKSVLPAEHAAAFREAISRHRERSLDGVSDTELPHTSLVELCTMILESCSNLSEAISELERLVGGKRPVESDGLRLGFATVLMRCRALFLDELNNDWILRERLVRVAETVLLMPKEGRFAFDFFLRSYEQSALLLLADQMLAICSIAPQTMLTEAGALAIIGICEAFKRVCYDKGTNPPVVKPGYKGYVDPFKRVEDRMKDPKICPRAPRPR